MAGPLTYAAVLILARDRIGQIRDMLRAKVATALPADVNDIERHILHLAERASDYLSGAATTPPPVRIYGPTLDTGVSQFAMLGAVGVELPSYGSDPWMAPLGNTLHHGTPDATREAVVAGSTDFVLNLWDELKQRVGDPAGSAAKIALLQQMRSAVLGHACHVATDMFVHPFLDGLDLPRATAASALEVFVSAQFLQRGNLTRIPSFSTFWPAAVDPIYFDGFRAAAQRTYGARRLGFGTFEASVATLPAVDFTTVRLEDGFRDLKPIIDFRYSWNLVDWMGATFWMFLPALVALPLAAALPQGRLLYRTPADLSRLGKTLDPSAAHYEIAAFSFASTALVPFVVTLSLTIAGLRAKAPLIFSWTNSVAWIIVAIAFAISTATSSGGDWWKWVFLLIVPLLSDVVTMIVAMTGARNEPRELQLVLGPLLHILCGLMFLGLYHGFLHQGVEALIDGKAGEFIGFFALWMLFLVVLWMGTALIMWGAFHNFSEEITNPAVSALTAEIAARHATLDLANAAALQSLLNSNTQDVANPIIGGPIFPRLFDDTVLYQQKIDGTAPGDAPSLAELFFPASGRPLLKLWWEGDANPPQIRPDGDKLIFRHGAATDQIVLAPRAPTKLSEFRDQLLARVKDSAGNLTHRLRARLAFDGAIEDVQLPPGPIFADNTVAANFVALPTTEATAYILSHASRERLAVRVGRRGALDLASRPTPVLPTDPASVLTTQATATQLRRTAGTDSLFAMFRPGDVVETTAAPPRRRTVVSVDADDRMTVSLPFPANLAGAAFRCLPRDPNRDVPGTGTVTAGPGPLDLTGTGTAFGVELKPGDVIRIQLVAVPPVPAQDRTVVSVVSNVRLTIDTPFAGLPAAPGIVFTRVNIRDVPGTGTVTRGTAAVDLAGTGTAFGSELRPGDVIRIQLLAVPAVPAQDRTVVSIVSDVLLTLDTPFAGLPAAPGIAFARVTEFDKERVMFMNPQQPLDDNIFVGETVMNNAADFAAMLMLGATSHVVPDSERAVRNSTVPLSKVYQVFRNWDLDRRRVNEWKMLVLGDAISEKRGAVAGPDAAVTLPSGWLVRSEKGEPVANGMGWLPMMRQWLDLARRPEVNTKAPQAFRADNPTNLNLSRALGFLFDIADPDPTAP